jgi:hypothetical protein
MRTAGLREPILLYVVYQNEMNHAWKHAGPRPPASPHGRSSGPYAPRVLTRRSRRPAWWRSWTDVPKRSVRVARKEVVGATPLASDSSERFVEDYEVLPLCE